jgi:hypothetical protein
VADFGDRRLNWGSLWRNQRGEEVEEVEEREGSRNGVEVAVRGLLYL